MHAVSCFYHYLQASVYYSYVPIPMSFNMHACIHKLQMHLHGGVMWSRDVPI